MHSPSHDKTAYVADDSCTDEDRPYASPGQIDTLGGACYHDEGSAERCDGECGADNEGLNGSKAPANVEQRIA